jgi:3-methylcrotonyl-CoA carboxylase alpha subunit
VLIGDKRIKGRVFIDGDAFHVFYAEASLASEWQNLLAHAADVEHGEGRLTVPMPGKVIAVLVEVGAVVEKGAPLLVREAMKMEHTIVAPAGGTVGEILFSVDD